MDEWVNKIWYIHEVQYFLVLKRKEILIQATTGVNIEDGMLSKISQMRKDEACMIPLGGGP